jgi:hypothetical protein
MFIHAPRSNGKAQRKPGKWGVWSLKHEAADLEDTDLPEPLDLRQPADVNTAVEWMSHWKPEKWDVLEAGGELP